MQRREIASASRDRRADYVVAALQRAFPALRPTGAGRWAARRGALAFELSADEHWLDIVAAAPRQANDTPLECLAANAALPATLKLTRRDGGARLAACLPLDNLAAIETRLRAAAAAIAGALGAATPAPAAAPVIDEGALHELVAATGWKFFDGIALRLEIEARGAAWLAHCTADDGGVALQLQLAEIPATSPAVCRDAVAELLWRANGAVRLARLELSDDGGEYRPRLWAALAGVPTATDIAHLAAALTVAARLCGRECEALATDPHLARLYRARAGTTSPTTTPALEQRPDDRRRTA